MSRFLKSAAVLSGVGVSVIGGSYLYEKHYLKKPLTTHEVMYKESMYPRIQQSKYVPKYIKESLIRPVERDQYVSGLDILLSSDNKDYFAVVNKACPDFSGVDFSGIERFKSLVANSFDPEKHQIVKLKIKEDSKMFVESYDSLSDYTNCEYEYVEHILGGDWNFDCDKEYLKTVSRCGSHRRQITFF